MQRTQVDSSAPSSMRSGRVYYLNGANNDLGYEKEVKDNGLIEHKHYLSAGGIVFAMQITRSGNTATGGASGSAKASQSLQYLHHDHLGSVAVVTDDTGSVIERLAYDPWGKRRFPNGTADTTDSIVGLTLDRGFTMHEHLDEMGVIHMNGRIYDPLIGRFMSADPFIQAPENLQSHNRFAYVMNNPLSYTDPSGYFSLKKLLRGIAAIAVAWFAPQVFATYGIAGASPLVAGIVNGAATGFLVGAISTGTLRGAALGALSGGIFGGIGVAAELGQWSLAAHIGAHAVAGCVTSVAGGGACGSGALSAAFGKFTTNWLKYESGISNRLAQGVISSVAGGVGSVIAGGKFENGATTAAFGYMFNEFADAMRGIAAHKIIVNTFQSLYPELDIKGEYSILNGRADMVVTTSDGIVSTKNVFEIKPQGTDMIAAEAQLTRYVNSLKITDAPGQFSRVGSWAETFSDLGNHAVVGLSIGSPTYLGGVAVSGFYTFGPGANTSGGLIFYGYSSSRTSGHQDAFMISSYPRRRR